MANWGHSNTPCMQSCEGTRLALGLQYCKGERFMSSFRHIPGDSRGPVWPCCSKTPWPMHNHLLLSIPANSSQVSRSTNNTSNSLTLIARLFISNQSPPAQEESNSWLALSQLKPVFSSRDKQWRAGLYSYHQHWLCNAWWGTPIASESLAMNNTSPKDRASSEAPGHLQPEPGGPRWHHGRAQRNGTRAHRAAERPPVNGVILPGCSQLLSRSGEEDDPTRKLPTWKWLWPRLGEEEQH